MQYAHAISPVGSDLGRYERSLSRDADFDRAFDRRQDEIRDDMDWKQLREIMAEAPEAQQKAFWGELIGLLDVQAPFIKKQNVSLIAAPLQEAVAVAVDTQVRKEFEQ